MASTNLLRNPFVGPRPLETGEKIYGRTRELAGLYNRLLADRILLLYSPSGAGKSSLMQAGLIPKMRESHDAWRPTRVNTPLPEGLPTSTNRYVLSMMMGLEAGVPEELRRPIAFLATQRLLEYVKNRPRHPDAPPNLLLVLDQFEEVLTTDPLAIDAKLEFFTQLGELLRSPEIWALLVLREDYLAAFDPYAKWIPTQMKNRFRIDRLGIEETARAIQDYASSEPRKFTPEAAKLLVQNLAKVKVQLPDGRFLEDQDGVYVEPMHLQVVCRDLWEAMPEDDLSVDPEDVVRFGDVAHALGNYYAHEVESISRNNKVVERRIRDWVGTELITAAGIRSQVLKGDSKTEGLDNELVEALVRSHLVRPEQRPSGTWYELAHDRLISPVRKSNAAWLEVNLQKVQKDAALWVQQKKKNQALLLLGEDLIAAQNWAEANPDSVLPVEEEFIALSAARQLELSRDAAAAEKELERARVARIRSRVYAAIAVVAIIAMIAAVYAYRMALDSSKRATLKEAEARQEKANAEFAACEAKDIAYLAQLNQEAAQLSGQAALKSAAAARSSAEEAKQHSEIARRNMVKLLFEKGRFALLAADTSGSAEDYQSAWIHNLAAMQLSKGPLPEAAGRLLQPEVWPEYKESSLLKPVKTSPFSLAAFEGNSGRLFLDSVGGQSASKPVLRCELPGQQRCPPSPPMSRTQAYISSRSVSVRSLAVSNQGTFAIGEANGSVHWCKASGCVSDIQSARARINALAFHENFLAAGTATGGLLVFDLSLPTPTVIAQSDQCDFQPCEIKSLAWTKGSAGELKIAAGTIGGVIQFFRLKDRSLLRSNSAFRLGPVTSMAFWPKNSMLASGYQDGTVRFWDSNGDLLSVNRLGSQPVLAITFDSEGKILTTASSDGEIRSTLLSAQAFGEEWKISDLISRKSSDRLNSLFRVSHLRLGYKSFGVEPIATPAVSALALKYFNAGLTPLFTDEQAAAGQITLRGVYPATKSFPSYDPAKDEFLVMPDDSRNTNTIIYVNKDIQRAFKVEFEYNIWKRRFREDGDTWTIGDWLSLQFFKRYDSSAPNKFFFEDDPTGYGVLFSFYRLDPYQGVQLHSFMNPAGQRLLKNVPQRIYTDNQWRKACVEVLPESRTSLCNPATKQTQGVSVYLDGALSFQHSESLDTKFGGLGFAAFSGQAVGERRVRNAILSSVEPDQTIQRTKLNSSNTRMWTNRKFTSDDLPRVKANVIELTPAARHMTAGAVLLNPAAGTSKPPDDFSIEFEYSLEYSEKDSEGMGNGLRFLFAKKLSDYQNRDLPLRSGQADFEESGLSVSFFDGIVLRNSGATTAARLSSAMPPTRARGEWRKVRVEIRRSTSRARVFYEGNEVIDCTIQLPPGSNSLGFGASTGDRTAARHLVRNVVMRDLNRKSSLR